MEPRSARSREIILIVHHGSNRGPLTGKGTTVITGGVTVRTYKKRKGFDTNNKLREAGTQYIEAITIGSTSV